MCGRATLATPPEELVRLFGLEPTEVSWSARYNIAPTQPVAVIVAQPPGMRVLGLMRWGLVRSFAEESRKDARMINVRVESLARRAIFREALVSRRCLVVVDGFYEWTHEGARRAPHYVRRANGNPMTLAGLWDTWQSPDGSVLESCAIVTIPATPPVASLHDRMPLIVSPGLIDVWLDPSRTRATDLALVLEARVDESELVTYSVHPRVNGPANDGPENVVPFELQRTLFAR
jgi:putative SOS response-associated peptidase YedK